MGFILTYESCTFIKQNKLDLLLCQYEFFNMEITKNIQSMFNIFHTILNELYYMDKHYDYCDEIKNILISLFICNGDYMLLRLWQAYQISQVVTSKTGLSFPKRLV